jgi:pilus assembly protein Flp/PilA
MSSIVRAIVTHLPDRPMRSETGQGLAEYALILALIAIVAIVALIFLGGQVSKILSNVSNSI